MVLPHRKPTHRKPTPHLINSTSTSAAPAHVSMQSLLQAISRALPEEPIPEDITHGQLECVAAALRRDLPDRALRYLQCRPVDKLLGPEERRRECRRYKACAYCAERWSRRQAERLLETVYGMTNPTAVLIRCPSRGATDLDVALATYKSALVKLRRRKLFREACTSGAIALELPMTADGHRWNLHGHGCLDVGITDLIELVEWSADVQALWKELTGNKGALFSLEDLRSPKHFTKYAVKLLGEKSWLETSAPARLRTHVALSLHRKRLVIRWGVSK